MFVRNVLFLTPPLFRPCFLTCASPQRTFALVSYPSPSQKKFCFAYEFSNEKLGSEKREKNQFFRKLNLKDQYFYTVIYAMTIRIFTSS